MAKRSSGKKQPDKKKSAAAATAAKKTASTAAKKKRPTYKSPANEEELNWPSRSGTTTAAPAATRKIKEPTVTAADDDETRKEKKQASKRPNFTTRAMAAARQLHQQEEEELDELDSSDSSKSSSKGKKKTIDRSNSASGSSSSEKRVTDEKIKDEKEIDQIDYGDDNGSNEEGRRSSVDSNISNLDILCQVADATLPSLTPTSTKSVTTVPLLTTLEPPIPQNPTTPHFGFTNLVPAAGPSLFRVSPPPQQQDFQQPRQSHTYDQQQQQRLFTNYIPHDQGQSLVYEGWRTYGTPIVEHAKTREQIDYEYELFLNATKGGYMPAGQVRGYIHPDEAPLPSHIAPIDPVFHAAVAQGSDDIEESLGNLQRELRAASSGTPLIAPQQTVIRYGRHASEPVYYGANYQGGLARPAPVVAHKVSRKRQREEEEEEEEEEEKESGTSSTSSASFGQTATDAAKRVRRRMCPTDSQATTTAGATSANSGAIMKGSITAIQQVVETITETVLVKNISPRSVDAADSLINLRQQGRSESISSQEGQPAAPIAQQEAVNTINTTPPLPTKQQQDTTTLATINQRTASQPLPVLQPVIKQTTSPSIETEKNTPSDNDEPVAEETIQAEEIKDEEEEEKEAARALQGDAGPRYLTRAKTRELSAAPTEVAEQPNVRQTTKRKNAPI